MLKLYVNQKPASEKWRQEIYSGVMYLWTKHKSAAALGDFAEECIKKFYGESDCLTAYLDWPVETFVEKTKALKTHYTNSREVKEIIREFVVEIGEKPDSYFFDVPRLRVIPNSDYLNSGVFYNYALHRDTWYGNPKQGINTWMPVFPIKSDQTMILYPSYFSKPVENSSDKFDVGHWNTVERPAAVSQVKSDTRIHPLLKEEISEESGMVIAGGRGDMLVFSGTHLHGSHVNSNKEIRFSTDFRLFSEADVNNDIGAPVVDDASYNKDQFIADAFRVSDFSRYQSEKAGSV